MVFQTLFREIDIGSIDAFRGIWQEIHAGNIDIACMFAVILCGNSIHCTVSKIDINHHINIAAQGEGIECGNSCLIVNHINITAIEG